MIEQLRQLMTLHANIIEEDAIAQQYVQGAFLDCCIRQIEMAEEIAKEGGALHCLSWNVYLPK